MSSALNRLEKILKLEQQQGYRNKAVIGGLERLSERWQEDAQAEVSGQFQQDLLTQILGILRKYPTLDAVEARREAVDSLLSLIDQWETGGSSDIEGVAVSAEPTTEPVQATAPRPAVETPQEKTTAKPKEPERSAAEDVISESRPTPVGTASLKASVSRLPGVGPNYTRRLASMGIHTIGDLLWLLPRRYEDFRSLKPIHQLQVGEDVTLLANLWDLKSRRLPGRNATLVTGVVGDSTATLQVTWFNPYVTKQLRVGQTYVFSGRVDAYLGRLVLRNPQFERPERDQVHTARLVPVYPLTKGITAKWLRRLQKQVIDSWGTRVHDPLPETVRQRLGLMTLSDALAQVHFPDDEANLKQARRRLAFDELFFLQVGVLRQRREWRAQPGRPFHLSATAETAFREALTFQFTAAQERVTRAIVADLAEDKPMSRLLQGDVGSGKTAVAAMAMWAVVSTGGQAAMMVPTEILAEQHYRGLSELFQRLQYDGRSVRIALLTGSLGAADKVEIRHSLAAGEIDVVVGTHALIQEGVEFSDLGLIVIDEQHRFGVRQRAMLRQKGSQNGTEEKLPAADPESTALDPGYVPHLLVMSATPIPRTLSLTIFGDLDVSVIDEMPPGRQPIKTRWLTPRERERAYSFLRRQVQAGHQAFIIYPLVEESESLEAGAAVPQYERLSQEIFPDLRLGLLHGRMKSSEKDAVMQAMQRGEIDVLVATSVVEVGIDIPNASLIIIEDAERFGLAQLHQFRGRVGRDEHASYCILVSGSSTGSAAERLLALEQSQDGFALAEKDLALRGPGDFFGVRQSGLPDLRLAQLTDLRTLEEARAEAVRLLKEDPDLERPEHVALARQAQQFWRGEGDIS